MQVQGNMDHHEYTDFLPRMDATEVKVILSLSVKVIARTTNTSVMTQAKQMALTLSVCSTRESTESAEPLILANYGFTHIFMNFSLKLKRKAVT